MTRARATSPGRAPGPAAPPGRILVWDPLVRVVHWTIALGVFANLTLFRHDKPSHIAIGYVVVAALGVRLVWGLIGTRHARFADFVARPQRLLGYLRAVRHRAEPRYIGHNPAGAAMIVLLLLLLAGAGVSGWMMGLDAYWGVTWVETVHELAANALVAAVGVHVLGAIVESVRHRENLPLAMITGYKREASGTDIDHAPPAGRG